MAPATFSSLDDHEVDSYGVDNDACDVVKITEGIGIPVAYVQREQDANFVAKHAWKSIDDPESAKATIGVAIGEGWEFAKKEVAFIRSKMQKKLGSDSPKPDAIFDLVLGEESIIHKTFQAAGIFQSYDDYCQFLATFYLSSACQVSTKQLFDKFSRICVDGCMEKEAYLNHWYKIGESGLPSKLERNRSTTPTGAKPLWMKIKDGYNNFCRDMFVDRYPGKMQTTCDDDKAHIQGNNYTAGLKLMKHTNDNVNGHTLHTLVYSLSQIPIQITWERAVNDNSKKAAERLYHSAITPMAASHGDLRNVGTGQDRGYWREYSLHEHAMRTGLEIRAATAMRQMSLAFNYAQEQSKDDPRTKIPVNGPKTLFTKCCISYSRKLYNVAYHNGRGHVILGLSTVYGAIPEWELAVSKPQDMEWYQDEGLSRSNKLPLSFKGVKMVEDAGKRQQIYGKLSEEFLSAVEGLRVDALTTTQGSPDWFLMRKFSLTSSTTDMAIASCSGKESWIVDQGDWETIKTVIGKQQDEIEQEEDELDQDKENIDKPETDEAPAEDSNAMPLSLEALVIDEVAVQTAKDQIAFEEYGIKQVRAVLTQLGKPLSKASSDEKKEDTDVKNFKLFLEAEPRFRRFVFAGKKELQRVAKELGINEKEGDSKALSASIQTHLVANPDATISLGQKKKESLKSKAKKAVEALDDRQRTLHSVLRATYLDPLVGKAKKYTRRGHILEMHLMRQCINEHKDEKLNSPLRLTEACTAPLVEKVGTRFARDSIDFIGMTTEGELIGIEVKARVSLKRDQAEQEHVREIRRLIGQDRMPQQRRRHYFQVEADSEAFPMIVEDTHEAVQVLHHAFVYDVSTVLLLVGDNNGGILYGIFVTVPTSIRKAYGNVITDIYKSALEWIYEPTATSRPREEEMERILDCLIVNEAPVNLHSFKMDLSLWRDINFKFSFPLPRLKSILPLIFLFGIISRADLMLPPIFFGIAIQVFRIMVPIRLL